MPGTLYLAVEGGSIDVQLDSFEQLSLYVILGISVLALAVAGFFAKQVLAAPRGTAKMIEISDAIQEGSRAYLKRQFRTLSIFVILLTLGLFFLPVGETTAAAGTVKFARSIAFLLGAGFSA
ncbi:hypothetical protein BH23ACT12_BH23ACT12_05080 [soil metagenome]